MEKVRTALIGCGKVGHTHAGAFAALDESEFVAVCDNNRARAEEFAAQYSVAAYTDIGEMVADARVDAVSVCTPHPLHAPLGIQSAAAGAHVLLEKPMASNLKDCDDMLDAADTAGIKLGIVSQRRLYEPVWRIREAIDAGKIGTPVLGTVLMLGWRDKDYYDSDPWRGTWDGEGGGVLVNQAPHQLDILQWFMGPIDELVGYWENLNHPYIEVEDTAIAMLRFKNGGLGNILVSNSQKPGIYGKVHVHGANGASVGVQTDGGAMFIAGMSSVLEPPILDFLQAIVEDRAPMVDGVEGRKAVEIIEAIYRSQRDGEAIKWPLAAEE
jgi:predicted dehydrogenase